MYRKNVEINYYAATRKPVLTALFTFHITKNIAQSGFQVLNQELPVCRPCIGNFFSKGEMTSKNFRKKQFKINRDRKKGAEGLESEAKFV
jgi:hypothetical protein